MYYLSLNELAAIWNTTGLYVTKAGMVPSWRLLRSVTSWYHSSNRSRSEFVRQLTAASGISWSEKSADASWFLVPGSGTGTDPVRETACLVRGTPVRLGRSSPRRDHGRVTGPSPGRE